jgi:hypothetical protein
MEGLSMRGLRYLIKFFVVIGAIVTWTASAVYAIDSETTRRTLSGLQGVNVVVEELQPNIQKYAQKFGLQSQQIKTDVEALLLKSGVRVLSHDRWLTAPGRPFLYVVVNTHEYEKYWFAYDIRIQLKQNVMLEMNPSIRTMASTWGISMTGSASVGKLNVLKIGVKELVGRFVEAYWSVNRG